MTEHWQPDEDAEPEPGQEVRRPGRWWCRLHLFHRWRTHHRPNAEDYGAQYQECLDCGKQRDRSRALPFAH